jgi:hypothetical protein
MTAAALVLMALGAAPGRAAVRVRVRFTAVETPLSPGRPSRNSAGARCGTPPTATACR